MKEPSAPTRETDRLKALAEYDLLDVPNEEVFDAFACVAAKSCGTPIAVIALAGPDKLTFKAHYGVKDVAETPFAESFTSYAIESNEIFEIPDARLDPRFAKNKHVTKNQAVTGMPDLVFYAAAPLITPAGVPVGTIAVCDDHPHTLTADQRAGLRAIADVVMDQFELRRRLKADASEMNERLSTLYAAMEATTEGVAISMLGETADDPTEIIYANDAFLRARGATREDVIGSNARQFTGPKTDMAVLRRMREALLRGESARAEYVTYRLDGTHFYASASAQPLLNKNGKPDRCVLILRDITESVLRGAELAMQNERLTALAAVARGIFAALEPHALVEALVGGVRELIGAESRLLVARPNGGFALTKDLLVPERAVSGGDAFIDAASRSDGALVDDGEHRAAIRIPGSLGQTRYILDIRSDRRLHQADVFAAGLLGQYFAVAARNVELYGELQARRAAVVELNQVKNDLIAMLAHDFKGPLTTIVGFADVLAEDERFDEESRKFLMMISSSAMRLASLATDTLALSRLEQNELTLELEEFDLVALVRDIVRVFSVTRSIDLRTDRDELRIGGDPGRLRQVFENLIGNAIKYSPGGEPIEVNLRAKGRGVEVSVRDHGIGIPEADKVKLFGRFARAQNARALGISGTGFGLYLTKTIVEMHGGTMSVDSVEGEGSTFRAFLPAAAAAPRPRHRRFILVDADGDAKSYVAHTLRDDGFAATVVADGKELLNTIDELQFDAAIVDVERVGMPLEEFVRRVAGRTALIRIDSSAVDEVPGWDGYIVKPFLTKDLHAAIEAAIMRHPKMKAEPSVAYS
ncbi:MAG: ATP-binding protein [Candidatus Lustribacter sp.]|jgi:PAS domain S-box-containing protein